MAMLSVDHSRPWLKLASSRKTRTTTESRKKKEKEKKKEETERTENQATERLKKRQISRDKPENTT